MISAKLMRDEVEFSNEELYNHLSHVQIAFPLAFYVEALKDVVYELFY